MSPYTADGPRTTHSKADRPTPVPSRILPAVPLAFSRPPQPAHATTPPLESEAPPSTAVAQPELPAHSLDAKADRAPTRPRSPLTPESKDSPAARAEPEKQLSGEVVAPSRPALPASSQDSATSTTAASSGNGPPPSQPRQALPKPSARIPRELPPPFYPSTDNHSAPTSTTSSNAPHIGNTNNAVMHHPRPSHNRIVFGGYPDSSNTSPAPPSAGMMAYPPPPPGYYPPGYGPPPFFPPGHAPPMSDPNGSLMYPPMSIPPANGYGYRRDQPPPSMPGRQQHWMMPDGPLPLPFRHHEPFSPRHVYAQTNGALDPHSRSGSQASTRTQENRDAGRPAPHHHHHPGGDAPASNGTFVNHRRDVVPDMPAFGLRDHVISQFGLPDFADHLLHVVHALGERPVLILPIHGVVVSRSPHLFSSMLALRSQEPMPGPKPLNLVVPKKYYTHQATTEAIKYLYGGQLLSDHGLEQGLPPFQEESLAATEFNLAQENMAQAIGYTSAGQALELAPVISNGVEVIKKLLRWDTIEKALTFALDYEPSPVKNGSLPNERPSDFNRTAPENYKPEIVGTIVEFIVANLPRDFELNSHASSLSGAPLLPVLADGRHATHHPRLSQIRFGELPPETASSHITTLLSSVLFSLPFLVLKHLLEHYGLSARLGSEKAVGLMRSVVEERERRRQKIASSKAHPQPLPVEDPLWQNVQYEERVEPSTQHGSGFHLSRHFVGLESPRA